MLACQKYVLTSTSNALLALLLVRHFLCKVLGSKVLIPASCRWSIGDASIFSVADGKRLAQEPPRLPTAFEAARMNRVTRAALESPLLSGYRCEP